MKKHIAIILAFMSLGVLTVQAQNVANQGAQAPVAKSAPANPNAQATHKASAANVNKKNAQSKTTGQKTLDEAAPQKKGTGQLVK